MTISAGIQRFCDSANQPAVVVLGEAMDDVDQQCDIEAAAEVVRQEVAGLQPNAPFEVWIRKQILRRTKGGGQVEDDGR